jgi:hypothetical protein
VAVLHTDGRVELLQPDELSRIERDHAKGVSARLIVEIFKPSGVRFSEATFRKYVQAGLLPRSRRFGRKGKHRGSQGLYPVESVRRINAIKKMMAEGHTLEDIKRSFVVFKNGIDVVERELLAVLDGFEAVLNDRQSSEKAHRELGVRLRALRVRARELLQDVARFGSVVTARRGADVEEL